MIPWMLAHPAVVLALWALAGAFLRALEHALRPWALARYPRAVHALDAIASLVPLLLPPLRSVLGVWRPELVPVLDAAAPPPARPSTLPPVTLVLLVVGLLGCPLPPPDGCTPGTTRCSPAGVPQVCSPSARWTAGDPPAVCTELGATVVCCLTASPYGHAVTACVPRAACLTDGGAP